MAYCFNRGALEALLGLLSRVYQKDTRICRRCAAMPGEVFCDRSLLGEAGACQFDTIAVCAKCGSATPCFGRPCELSERISKIRLANPEYVERERRGSV